MGSSCGAGATVRDARDGSGGCVDHGRRRWRAHGSCTPGVHSAVAGGAAAGSVASGGASAGAVASGPALPVLRRRRRFRWRFRRLRRCRCRWRRPGVSGVAVAGPGVAVSLAPPAPVSLRRLRQLPPPAARRVAARRPSLPVQLPPGPAPRRAACGCAVVAVDRLGFGAACHIAVGSRLAGVARCRAAVDCGPAACRTRRRGPEPAPRRAPRRSGQPMSRRCHHRPRRRRRVCRDPDQARCRDRVGRGSQRYPVSSGTQVKGGLLASTGFRVLSVAAFGLALLAVGRGLLRRPRRGTTGPGTFVAGSTPR